MNTLLAPISIWQQSVSPKTGWSISKEPECQDCWILFKNKYYWRCAEPDHFGAQGQKQIQGLSRFICLGDYRPLYSFVSHFRHVQSVPQTHSGEWLIHNTQTGIYYLCEEDFVSGLKADPDPVRPGAYFGGTYDPYRCYWTHTNTPVKAILQKEEQRFAERPSDYMQVKEVIQTVEEGPGMNDERNALIAFSRGAEQGAALTMASQKPESGFYTVALTSFEEERKELVQFGLVSKDVEEETAEETQRLLVLSKDKEESLKTTPQFQELGDDKETETTLCEQDELPILDSGLCSFKELEEDDPETNQYIIADQTPCEFNEVEADETEYPSKVSADEIIDPSLCGFQEIEEETDETESLPKVLADESALYAFQEIEEEDDESICSFHDEDQRADDAEDDPGIIIQEHRDSESFCAIFNEEIKETDHYCSLIKEEESTWSETESQMSEDQDETVVFQSDPETTLSSEEETTESDNTVCFVQDPESVDTKIQGSDLVLCKDQVLPQSESDETADEYLQPDQTQCVFEDTEEDNGESIEDQRATVETVKETDYHRFFEDTVDAQMDRILGIHLLQNNADECEYDIVYKRIPDAHFEETEDDSNIGRETTRKLDSPKTVLDKARETAGFSSLISHQEAEKPTVSQPLVLEVFVRNEGDPEDESDEYFAFV